MPTTLTEQQRRWWFTGSSDNDVWDDLRFPAQGINPAGAASPPALDDSVTSFPGTFLFSGSQENVIAGIAQMPHEWLAGSDVKPHIHWSKPTGSSSAVSWVFYYRHIGSPGDAPGTWSDAVVGTLVAGDQTVSDQQLITSFGLLDMTGRKESACINWRIHRLGNSDADNNAVRFLEFDIHFQRQAGKRGTIEEFPT